ncbi:MAG: hypothetical protein MR648_11240 [Clostridiales bacterium]|nr:hypothetical protein [Clostridiales bacterium]MDY4180918.1 hypothetical protein [Pseudoflavonifractor sp.]
MRTKKIVCAVLSCAILASGFCMHAQAAEPAAAQEAIAIEIQRATNRFNISAPPKKIIGADISFSMAAGESVTINASYLPKTASVDFGLVDSDGIFHFVNVTGGSIDKTIRIKESGNYTFAVRNNSSSTIEVSGFVNY